MTDEAQPIAYSALPKGVPMLSSSGTQFGRVEHVLQVPEEDLFDGIVVDAPDGLRFVDRDQIVEITTAYVRCSLTDEQAAALPAPDGKAVYEDDPLQNAGQSLHDHFGRMFRREHWIRDT